jgi:hypothetical protein
MQKMMMNRFPPRTLPSSSTTTPINESSRSSIIPIQQSQTTGNSNTTTINSPSTTTQQHVPLAVRYPPPKIPYQRLNTPIPNIQNSNNNNNNSTSVLQKDQAFVTWNDYQQLVREFEREKSEKEYYMNLSNTLDQEVSVLKSELGNLWERIQELESKQQQQQPVKDNSPQLNQSKKQSPSSNGSVSNTTRNQNILSETTNSQRKQYKEKKIISTSEEDSPHHSPLKLSPPIIEVDENEPIEISDSEMDNNDENTFEAIGLEQHESMLALLGIAPPSVSPSPRLSDPPNVPLRTSPSISPPAIPPSDSASVSPHKQRPPKKRIQPILQSKTTQSVKEKTKTTSTSGKRDRSQLKNTSSSSSVKPPPAKRPRGRPRKNPLPMIKPTTESEPISTTITNTTTTVLTDPLPTRTSQQSIPSDDSYLDILKNVFNESD